MRTKDPPLLAEFFLEAICQGCWPAVDGLGVVFDDGPVACFFDFDFDSFLVWQFDGAGCVADGNAVEGDGGSFGFGDEEGFNGFELDVFAIGSFFLGIGGTADKEAEG